MRSDTLLITGFSIGVRRHHPKTNQAWIATMIQMLGASWSWGCASAHDRRDQSRPATPGSCLGGIRRFIRPG
jgi:hypothetical protein